MPKSNRKMQAEVAALLNDGVNTVVNLDANTVEPAFSTASPPDDSTPVIEGGEPSSQEVGDTTGARAISLLSPTQAINSVNSLFDTAKAANAFWQAWNEQDARGLELARRAMCEMVIKFAMCAEPGKNNAEPLTHAVKAMLHRGKGGLASKAKAWVAGCTAYKWSDKQQSFGLKQSHKANLTFNEAQREVYNTHFDQYTKPTNTKAWQLRKALEAVLKKAERMNVDTTEIKAEIALIANGLPEVVNVSNEAGAHIRRGGDTSAHVIAENTANNDKDAA